MYTILTGPLTNPDALLWNACLTDVQKRALLDWASTQRPETYEDIRRAVEAPQPVV